MLCLKGCSHSCRRVTYLCPVIAAVLLGRNPVLFDTFGAKELDPGLELAGVTYTMSNPGGQREVFRRIQKYRPEVGWARLYLPTNASEYISEFTERNTSREQNFRVAGSRRIR
jgi:hypothetical protein